MLPSRAIRGLIFALLALVLALDGYAAYAAPIWAKKDPGYAQPSYPKAALTLAALATSDDDDEHSRGSGNPPDALLSEPLAPVIFAECKAWFLKARPAGQLVQHPRCAGPQTGPPPAHATA